MADDAAAMTTFPAALLAAALLVLMLAFVGEARAGKRRRQRIDRARRAVPGELASRDLALPTSVRRQPTRALLGRIGNDLARLLPKTAVLRDRLDRAGIGLNVVDYGFLCAAAGLVQRQA